MPFGNDPNNLKDNPKSVKHTAKKKKRNGQNDYIFSMSGKNELKNYIPSYYIDHFVYKNLKLS